MELSDKIIDRKSDNNNFVAEFYEHIHENYDKAEAAVLCMTFEGYKRPEILKKYFMTVEEYNALLQQFAESFDC